MRDPNLDKLIQDIKTKKFREGEAKGLVSSIGTELKEQIAPVMEGLVNDLQAAATEAITSALRNIKIDSPEMPQIDIDTSGIEQAIQSALSGININVPETKMPTMKAPIVNIPENKTLIPEYDAGTVQYTIEPSTECWTLTKNGKTVAKVTLTYFDTDRTELSGFNIEKV